MEQNGLEQQDYGTPHGGLFRLSLGRADLEPVLITHGTFSNRTTCLPIAMFFANLGNPTYVLEWRGRDVGPLKSRRFTYWDLADDELTHATRHVSDQHSKPVHLVAHSGGGLAASLMLACDRQSLKNTASVTMLATQSTHLASLPLMARWKTAALVHAARIPGYWPRRLLKLGPTNESAYLKVQWHLWNKTGRILCRDGGDLFGQLANCKTPALAVAGKADTFIAPAAGCEALLNAYGGPKRFVLAGQSEGFSEDFNHSRLWKSRAAEQDLWPQIASWIASHSP